MKVCEQVPNQSNIVSDIGQKTTNDTKQYSLYGSSYGEDEKKVLSQQEVEGLEILEELQLCKLRIRHFAHLAACNDTAAKQQLEKIVVHYSLDEDGNKQKVSEQHVYRQVDCDREIQAYLHRATQIVKTRHEIGVMIKSEKPDEYGQGVLDFFEKMQTVSSLEL